MQTSCGCAILNPALIQLMSAALSGFNLGTVLLASIVLFPLACCSSEPKVATTTPTSTTATARRTERSFRPLTPHR